MDYFKNVYVLRWRFDFRHKMPVCGMWLNPGSKEDLKTKAYSQDLSHAFKATIEGRDRQTGVTKDMAFCDIENFMRFEWISVNPIPFGHNMIVRPNPVGLAIVTKDGRRGECFIDGTTRLKRLSR